MFVQLNEKKVGAMMDRTNEVLADLTKEEKLSLKCFIGFSRTERALKDRKNEVIKRYSITPNQFGVLEALRTKGSLSIHDIIEKTLSTSGNMTVVIKNMDRDGYIKRTTDPKDNRKTIVEITEKGLSIIESMWSEHVENLDNIFSPLTNKEKEELIRLLKKLK